MRMRWNRLAGVVALVATFGATAAAFQIDPDVLTDVSTPATGLWVPAPDTGEIVRVDAASGEVTARVEVANSGAELVLSERENGVVVVNRTTGRVALVDPALHEVVRSVDGVAASEALVDIGPGGVVAVSGSEVVLVDLEVTGSTSARVPPAARSVVADGQGAQVENGTARVRISADGSSEDESAVDGRLVRVDDQILVAGSDSVRTLGGTRAACFDGQVIDPEHLIGASPNWVVAVSGRRVHIADLSDGQCVAVSLSVDGAELGRPVVAEGRVFVPERRTGVVHIVDPSRAVEVSHRVLPAGDMRLQARAGFVVAYDAGGPFAALLDGDGIVRFVDTSVDGRGFAAVLSDDGAARVEGGGDTSEAAEVGAADSAPDVVSTATDGPLIDSSVLLTEVQSPVDDDVADEAVPDDELVANFALSASTVTVGESVRFVDGSTGGPDSWLWDFGDGTGAQGPEAEKTWVEPGTYPVTLRVTRGDETAEISLAVTVVPAEVTLPPAADFVFSSTIVSVGEPIAFEDRSDGEITRWLWDFGDGTNATDPNVTKSWSQPGRYAVQLTVANEQGSDSALVFIEVIQGLEAPVAVLTAPETDLDLGAAVTFRGSSSTDPANYTWDFGDGRTSSGAEVVHVFLAEGTFTVTLTATNAAGVSTATVEVSVAPPTQPPAAVIGALPTVIEVGEVVTLSSLSTNSPDVETWSFGDGESATGTRVIHSWQSPGSYLLTLTATNSAGTGSVTITVEVVPELPTPVAQIGDFNASPWVGDTTVFIDASVDASSWLWDFGDGGTSNSPNPLHTFTTAGPKIVTLTVTNRNGSDSASVVVEPRLQPIASFLVSSTAVRAGEAVTFSDDSVNAASWSWDFGDGSSSEVQNPVHTFADPGTYEVTLTIESATGDQDSFGPVAISVDPAPPRLSGIEKVPVDTGDITTLTSASFSAVVDAASGPIDRYQIDFGDGSSPASAAGGTFSHTYTASGTYVVTMRARGPLGDFSDPVTRSFEVVDPPPPLVDIADSVPATAEVGLVTLTGVELGGSGPISTWRWEIRFESNLWEYTGQVANHLFETAGDYDIRLIAESPVAAVPDAEVDQNITITIPPPPTIESLTANPSPATTGVTVSFTPVVTGSVVTYEWDYEGGGYLTGASVGQHIFNSPGDKQVSLRVTDAFGRQAARTIDLTVNPEPSPTVPVAVPGGTVLTNTTVNLSSTDAGGLTGLTWDWEITNGATTITYTDVGPSIDHLFDTPGSWTVTVTATDGLGISGSNFRFVTVQDPDPLVAGFTSAVTGTPLQIQFTDTSTGPPISSWAWNFGDPGAVGNTTAQNPLVMYSGPGTYSVSLTVTSGGDVSMFTDFVTVP